MSHSITKALVLGLVGSLSIKDVDERVRTSTLAWHVQVFSILQHASLHQMFGTADRALQIIANITTSEERQLCRSCRIHLGEGSGFSAFPSLG